MNYKLLCLASLLSMGCFGVNAMSTDTSSTSTSSSDSSSSSSSSSSSDWDRGGYAGWLKENGSEQETSWDGFRAID